MRSRPRSSLCLAQHFPWARSQDLFVSGWSSQLKIISYSWTCSQCHCGRVTTLARESWSNCVKKTTCYKQFLFLQGTDEEIFSAVFGTLSAKTAKKTRPKGSLSTYKDVSVGEHVVVGHSLQQVARGDKSIRKSWYRIIKEDYLRFVLNVVLLYAMFFEGTFKKRSILGKTAIQNTLNHSQLNRKQYMSLLCSCLSTSLIIFLISGVDCNTGLMLNSPR